MSYTNYTIKESTQRPLALQTLAISLCDLKTSLTSYQLAMNLGILMITPNFDNSLEKLIELKKVLHLWWQFYYNKRIPIRIRQKEEIQDGIWDVYKHDTLVSISCGVRDDVTSF